MQRKEIIKKIVIACCIIFALNWIGNSIYSRFDLTEDKRYTLSDNTREFIKNLEDTIRFSVYLHGDLPITFTKMRREVSDFLQEIKRLGGSNIQILFIDPLNIGSDPKANREAFQRLTRYGLKPFTIQEQDHTGKFVQRPIMPGFIVSTSERYVPVNLFENVIGSSTEEQVYEALGKLEYMCIKAMKQLTMQHQKNIAFIRDKGQLPFNRVFDATVSLMEMYNVDRINMRDLLDSIDKYDVVILTKPKQAFTDADKFILDQYLMRNGALLGFIDMVHVDADALRYASNTMAEPKNLEISDLLFHLGVRINPTILLDNQCARIPLNMAPPGSQPNFQPVPWFYLPLLQGNPDHIISQNLNIVKAEYASTIDTVEGGGNLSKQILLRSSAYARVLQTPVSVGFSILDRISANYFNQYFVPVAALVEGKLESFYRRRSIPIPAEELPQGFEVKHATEHAAMIFVADGDIIKNEIEVRGKDTVPQALHVYKYYAIDRRVYTGNKEFLLNSVNYLCGDSDLIPLRSREMKIRMLNRTRVLKEQRNWQLLNIAVPIIIISFAGLLVIYFRKRKYSRYVG